MYIPRGISSSVSNSTHDEIPSLIISLLPVGMKIHDLWDDHRVAFIPADKDDVNRLTACFCESPLEERRENNLDQVSLTVIWVVDLT